MPSALERALARFRRRPDDDGGETRSRISAAEFRAATEQRLRSLEREVAEVKDIGQSNNPTVSDNGRFVGL